MRVIIAGLDQDYTGKPWEPMPQLLAFAEYITKMQAICKKCVANANYSQRTLNQKSASPSACTEFAAAVASSHADAPTVHPE